MGPLAVSAGLGDIEEAEAFGGGEDIVEDASIERGVFGDSRGAKVNRGFDDLSWGGEELRCGGVLIIHGRKCSIDAQDSP